MDLYVHDTKDLTSLTDPKNEQLMSRINYDGKDTEVLPLLAKYSC
jgi:hypothetical protein